MNIKIGTAPDAWGVWFPDDPKQISAIRFLDEVVEAGFEWIELGPYGYLPIKLSKLRSELDQRGLKVCACVVEGNLEEPSAWPGVEKQVLGGGELAAGLDGRFMVLIDEGYVDLVTDKPNGPTRLDEDAWSRLIDTTQKIAQMARDRFALKVAFHPNAETHVESEDQIETLLEQTDPDLVSLCVDLGHHAYRGGDPVAFIRRHHQRILHIHFKNVEGQVLKQIEAKKSKWVKQLEWAYSAGWPRARLITRRCGTSFGKLITTALGSSNKTCTPCRSTSRCPSPSAAVLTCGKLASAEWVVLRSGSPLQMGIFVTLTFGHDARGELRLRIIFRVVHPQDKKQYQHAYKTPSPAFLEDFRFF